MTTVYAFTPADELVYPPYVNIERSVDGDYVVTVRAEKIENAMQAIPVIPGATAQITISRKELVEMGRAMLAEHMTRLSRRA